MVCICVCRNANTTAHMEVRGQTEVLVYLSSLFVARGGSLCCLLLGPYTRVGAYELSGLFGLCLPSAAKAL